MKFGKLKRKWRNSKFRAALVKFSIWRKNLSKVRLIFIIYLLVVLLCSILLYCKFTQNPGHNVSFSDAFFITSSAFSDTGLLMHSTYNTWNMFGQAIIAILIFIGGLGIFALKVFIINFLFKSSTSLSESELVATERGSADSRQALKIIVDSIGILLFVFIMFSFGLSIYFYYVNPTISKELAGDYISPVGNWALSFRYGFFHTISALNNAGFDIIGENSLAPYYNNIGLQIIFIILFVIGGLGYPVIHDCLDFIRFKIKNPKGHFRWTLFTKLSTLTYLITTIVGFLLLISFEIPNKNASGFWNNDTSYFGNKASRLWALIFCSFSSRSAGFATFDMHSLTSTSLIIVGILMFIGAAPASTGGGIRTTTLAVLIVALFSKILGRSQAQIFKRKITDETIKKAFYVFFISLFIVLITCLIVASSMDNYFGTLPQKDFGISEIFFEVCSAFGTSGISAGVTKHFNLASKIFVAIVMFIGQFGISSSILIWTSKKNNKNSYTYISEDIAIG